MITVVTGLPRSGTSLMMKMLHAGGMPVYAEEFPVFETPKIYRLRYGDTAWLDDCEGKCVKVLEPHKNPLPVGREYRFLWMRRGWRAIARSQIKCLNSFSPGPERIPHKAGLDELRRRTKEGLKAVRALGETWVFQFEDILKDPLKQAGRLWTAMQDEMLNPYAMARVVLARETAVLPDIREYEWGGQWNTARS